MADSPDNVFTDIIVDPIINAKHSDLINLPKVVFVNEFTESSAKDFMKDMFEAENSDQDIIPIFIDSYGGDVYSLLAMIDCIKSSKKKVATVSIGKSMSCGAVLLSCGHEGYRFASPCSTILIHDVSSWSYGKVEELKSDAGEVERLNKFIYHMMASNCGQPKKYFLKLVHDRGHADWFITPEEAKEHKLVNHIRVPKFQVKVSAEIKLI